MGQACGKALIICSFYNEVCKAIDEAMQELLNIVDLPMNI